MDSRILCSPKKAAYILGVSVLLVKQLIENGSLWGWKTSGGHRRISLVAIAAYQKSLSLVAKSDVLRPPVSIYVLAKSGADQRSIYEEKILSVDRQVEQRYGKNGAEALLGILKYRPDILLIDIEEDCIDLLDVVNELLNMPSKAPDNIAFVSSLSAESLRKKSRIPNGFALFSKPLNVDEFRGYLLACKAIKARTSRSGEIQSVAI